MLVRQIALDSSILLPKDLLQHCSNPIEDLVLWLHSIKLTLQQQISYCYSVTKVLEGR